MSYGIESYGVGSYGTPDSISSQDATAPGSTLTGASSIVPGAATAAGDATASGASLTGSSTLIAGAASGGSVYDYRIAVIGDSNASGRGTNSQPITGTLAYLYNNAGSVVPLADPWDGGTNTYAALDDGSSADGSFAVRLAQHFTDAGKSVLWIPANKGGTQASNWAYSTLTSTCYGAMKARIDAAGGATDIIIQLGANDAIGSVSQSLFKTRIEAVIAALRSDYPSARIYLNKIHFFAGYTAGITAIRAAVDEVWAAGANGILPGADLDGISPSNVHYMTDADLTAVGDRIYTAMTSTDATATGATLEGTSTLSAGSAIGEQNAVAGGATLDAISSMVAGAASAGASGDATASGAVLIATSSIVPGAADSQQNATAPSATLTALTSFVPGSADGVMNATAAGADLVGSASVVYGAAFGEVDAIAPGASLTGSASLIPGDASSATNAVALGAMLAGSSIIIPGGAEGIRNAIAQGAILLGTATIIPGSGSNISAQRRVPASRTFVLAERDDTMGQEERTWVLS